MKRAILRLSSIILIGALLSGAVLSVIIIYSSRMIDYELDKMLFEQVDDNLATYYYAYDENDNPVEVWNSASFDRKDWVDFSDIGDNLKKAFISVEDRQFYKHKGINLGRTIKAAINYVLKIQPKFGASTITQQVIKNISGDNENSIARKFSEILRALALERNYSKDEIFEVYLNIAPMSNNMYGVGMASNMYFNKEPDELTVSEAAVIVGITNAPTKYNPYVNPEACLEKRNKVLYAMYDTGAISDSEYNSAIKEHLNISERGLCNSHCSSWFIETARDDVQRALSDKYSISRAASSMMLSGAKIILTMNIKVQSILDDFFYNTDNLSANAKDGLNYAMVISEHDTGNLLGIIGNGGRKNGEMLYNHATNPKIPGSVLKPLALYAPLIDEGQINWSTLFDDSPLRYNDDGSAYPKNSPDIYEGSIDINRALSKSKNTVAVRLYNMLGPDKIYYKLQDDLGIKTIYKEYKTKNGLYTDLAESPLALGQLTVGISLRKLTECYNIFPNNGVLSNGNSFYAVKDKNDNIICESFSSKTRVFKSETAQIVNQMLMNVLTDGTAKRVKLKENVDTAGKTGTSGADKDRLFIGYTPYFTAGIWCGYSKDGRPVGDNTPSHIEVWDRVMTRIHNELVFNNYSESYKFFDTSSLYHIPYCPFSGSIINDSCIEEGCDLLYGYFSEDNLPREKCEYH